METPPHKCNGHARRHTSLRSIVASALTPGHQLELCYTNRHYHHADKRPLRSELRGGNIKHRLKASLRKRKSKAMSLVPLIFWWENLDEPNRVLDQHFGVGVNPETQSPITTNHLYTNLLRKQLPSRCPMASYYRPWGKMTRQGNGGSSTVKADKEKFQVILDVQQFSPEDISVKVVDQYVVVEGKHEEKQDEHGWVSRQFSRRYMIPEQCDIDQVTSQLSSDGYLTICVARKEKPGSDGERVINIEHTGKPAIQDIEGSRKKSEEKMEEGS